MTTYRDYQHLKATKPLRWWHESIMDWMLTHPGASLRDMAKEFGRTPTHMSIIINTDMFRAKLAERRAKFNDEFGQSVQRKMLGALDLALDVVTEQMKTKRAQIPFKDTSAFVNSTLERLGYGTKQNGVTVNVSPQQVTVTASDLAEARALLRRSETARLIDTTTVPFGNAPPAALEEPTLRIVEERSDKPSLPHSVPTSDAA